MRLNAQVQRAGRTGAAPPHLCRNFEALKTMRIVSCNRRYAFLLLHLLSEDSEGGDGRVTGRCVFLGIHVTQDCVGFDAPTVVWVGGWGGGRVREKDLFRDERAYKSPKTV
jgi:hypothetical protein